MTNTPLLPLLGLLGCLATMPVSAKLPAPSDEATAKSAETAAKTAHAGKVVSYKLCLAMDRVAALYLATAKRDGKAVKVPVETPACGDPWPVQPGAARAQAADRGCRRAFAGGDRQSPAQQLDTGGRIAGQEVNQGAEPDGRHPTPCAGRSHDDGRRYRRYQRDG